MTCAAVLIQLQARGILRGQLIKLYIIAYLLYRFATEFIRPEPKLWLDFSVYQWAAVLLLPVFALLWVRDRQNAASIISAPPATSP
jgi:phosphatidylglycerol---prolipoprotein diacylglyceryl transferase